MKNWMVAMWAVLAFLLLSKTAYAVESLPTVKMLALQHRDSVSLMARMKYPLLKETYREIPIVTKRFQTADGAIRFDCGQNQRPNRTNPTICAITIDSSKSLEKVSKITAGYVEKSIVFKILEKNDVASMLANMVSTSGAFYSSEAVVVQNEKKKNMSVPRFYYNCPRDWVFDVVTCEGHIILR